MESDPPSGAAPFWNDFPFPEAVAVICVLSRSSLNMGAFASVHDDFTPERVTSEPEFTSQPRNARPSPHNVRYRSKAFGFVSYMYF